MACQPRGTSGAAPASVAAADISACLPESVGQGSLVTKDQREVCRLSPWGDVAAAAQPLSALLPSGLRLLPPPLPAVPSAYLAVRVPSRLSRWGDDGLTTFRRCYGV